MFIVPINIISKEDNMIRYNCMYLLKLFVSDKDDINQL